MFKQLKTVIKVHQTKAFRKKLKLWMLLARGVYENTCLGVAEMKQQKTRENYGTRS